MKILLVIHGYPPYNMAGSEVYTYNLARALSKKADVFVFTRIEDRSKAGTAFFDSVENGVNIRRVNSLDSTDTTFYNKYLNSNIEESFRAYMRFVSPDVVHFGHCAHLSVLLPVIAKQEFGLPVFFTIHDFWMFCHRGQLLNPEDSHICNLPNECRCTDCARFHYRSPAFKQEWIRERNVAINRTLACIDRFFAPSHTLERFYLDMGIPRWKVLYSKYGFDLKHIKPIVRQHNGKLRIGFIGRIIPSKGVHLLCKAFSQTKGNAELLVFGELTSKYGHCSKVSGNEVLI